MNTKILMTVSALFMAIIGIFFTFLPKETAMFLNIDANLITILIMSLTGALYWGFGILNWMAKETLIGGIYNRPITLGNLLHFGTGGIALVKIVSDVERNSEIIILLSVVYSVLAIFFAYVFKTNPSKIKK